LLTGLGRLDSVCGGIAGILCTLGNVGDFDSKTQRQHDKRLGAIGAHNQKVGAIHPFVELAESIAAHLDFHPAIDTEQRNRYVTAETTTRGSAERDTLAGESVFLEDTNQRAFRAVTLLA
jgi:hypothetical protein